MLQKALCSTASHASVHAQKKYVQEHQFAFMPLSTWAIALNYLELHVWSAICVPEIQSFLLLENAKYLILDKTGESRAMKVKADCL